MLNTELRKQKKKYSHLAGSIQQDKRREVQLAESTPSIMQMQPTENIKKMKKQKVLHRLND
jgi:hypothetical protein